MQVSKAIFMLAVLMPLSFAQPIFAQEQVVISKPAPNQTAKTNERGSVKREADSGQEPGADQAARTPAPVATTGSMGHMRSLTLDIWKRGHTAERSTLTA